MNPMRQKSFGMLYGRRFLPLATCENRNGKWHLLSTSRWSGDNWLKNALLLHRGVIAAAPCRWLPAEHLPSDGIAPPPMAARLSRANRALVRTYFRASREPTWWIRWKADRSVANFSAKRCAIFCNRRRSYRRRTTVRRSKARAPFWFLRKYGIYSERWPVFSVMK